MCGPKIGHLLGQFEDYTPQGEFSDFPYEDAFLPSNPSSLDPASLLEPYKFDINSGACFVENYNLYDSSGVHQYVLPNSFPCAEHTDTSPSLSDKNSSVTQSRSTGEPANAITNTDFPAFVGEVYDDPNSSERETVQISNDSRICLAKKEGNLDFGSPASDLGNRIICNGDERNLSGFRDNEVSLNQIGDSPKSAEERTAHKIDETEKVLTRNNKNSNLCGPALSVDDRIFNFLEKQNLSVFQGLTQSRLSQSNNCDLESTEQTTAKKICETDDVVMKTEKNLNLINPSTNINDQILYSKDDKNVKNGDNEIKPIVASKTGKNKRKKKQVHQLRVKHDYTDYSELPFENIALPFTCGITQKRTHKSNRLRFTEKLHVMLEQVELEKCPDDSDLAGFFRSSIISWQPHGRCFIVHKTDIFVKDILPQFFNQSKLTSFQRQLNLYGFRRITKRGSPDEGAYYHELFLRHRIDICSKMTRVKVKGTGCKAAHSPETEPNFYKMKPIFSFPMLQYHLLGAPLAHAGVNFHHSNIKAFSIPIPSLLNSGVSTSISCKGNEMNKVNEKPEVWNTQTPGCITSSKQNVPDNCAQQRGNFLIYPVICAYCCGD